MELLFLYETDLIVTNDEAGKDNGEILKVYPDEPLEVSLMRPSDEMENATDLYLGDLRFVFGVPNHLFITKSAAEII